MQSFGCVNYQRYDTDLETARPEILSGSAAPPETFYYPFQPYKLDRNKEKNTLAPPRTSTICSFFGCFCSRSAIIAPDPPK